MRPLSTPVTQTGIAAPQILVVDDEQYMCDVCSRALSRGGYTVMATSDPDQAVRLLRSNNYDLLLTDIKMPAMSGLDLAHIARECDPAMAIIIMTGFASIEHLHQSVKRGVADFISKPFELDHLRLAVDQALHKRMLLQDNLRLQAVAQLLEHSEQLSTTLELAELTSILLRVMLAQSGCRTGFVLLSNGQEPLGQLHTATPTAALTLAGRQLAEQAWHNQQSVSGQSDVYASLNEDTLHYALAAPLRAQGDVQGVIVLCDDREHVLRPGVEEGVLLLANHAGAALRNAYLHTQTEIAYQRLQELDRLKSEFIAIASHELRTPLSIMLGYSMMVHDQSAGEQREYMQRVMESTQRIKEVVDDMVSLRHLETGETAPALEQIVAQELVQQAVENVAPLMRNSKHQIALHIPTAPITFESDREKVQLVLNHLLANAIKFTPGGGKITVTVELRPSTDLIEPSAFFLPKSPEPGQQWIVFRVQDMGIGIAERELRRIFDRFYQVADSLRRDRGGIGLGLALVRELATNLGGIVWVVSHPNQGSMFAIALPYPR